MTTVTASPPSGALRTRDRDAGQPHPRPDPRRPWIWALVEALAYAGAAFDPTAALAARRLARIRDQELHAGRR